MAWETDTPRRDRLPPRWTTIRAGVLTRDQWQCQLRYDGCQILATEVDHIQPGDDHTPANLQSVCARCHSTKSAREGVAARVTIARRGTRPPETHPGLTRER